MILLVVSLVLAFTLPGTSKPPAPTTAQVRAAAQTNLTETTQIMATYSKARAACTDAPCVAAAAKKAESAMETSWSKFNTAATGYTPLASSLATYAVDYSKLLAAFGALASATTLAQIDVIEANTFSAAQGTWLAEASALYGQLGGKVAGPGASTTSTTQATTTTS